MFVASSDVAITSSQIILPSISSASENSLQTSAVKMFFMFDGIALEPNETFTLGFTFSPAERFGTNPTLRDSFTGTVIDANGNAIVYSLFFLFNVFIQCRGHFSIL